MRHGAALPERLSLVPPLARPWLKTVAKVSGAENFVGSL